MARVLAACLLVGLGMLPVVAEPTIAVPDGPGTQKFAVLGDNGSGNQGQYDLAAQMAAVHRQFAFSFVVMVGDNCYGSQRPGGLEKKFARPYKPLVDAGVAFHAALGNQDQPHIVSYPPQRMGGQRYYTYVRQHVRFFVLDTNILDAPQLRWFESALQQASEAWKIVYSHDLIYGNVLVRHACRSSFPDTTTSTNV